MIRAQRHKPDVGQRIKSWRSRRKLSQMELAGMANISARHLSFIETGRGNASPATLLSLASNLQIPLQEQNRLLLAAGFAPRFEEAPLCDEKMTHMRQIVELVLSSHEPFPAFAVDRTWNIVLANEAHYKTTELMIDNATRTEIGGNNVFRLVYHPKGLRNHIANWAQLSPYMLRTLRQQCALFPNDENLGALSADIEKWAQFDDQQFDVSTGYESEFALPIVFRVGDTELSLVSTMLRFVAPLSAAIEDLTIETFYAADPESQKIAESLVSGP